MSKVVFNFVLLPAMLLFSSCFQKDPDQKLNPDIVKNPVTADGTTDLKNLPVFEFEKDNHEFGEITEGETVSYNFKFKNTGKSPLIITSASASCGCTVPEYSKDPVAAGDQGFIKVTFNSEGKHGMVSKNVTLLANTIPNTKVLTISAEIISKDKQ